MGGWGIVLLLVVFGVWLYIKNTKPRLKNGQTVLDQFRVVDTEAAMIFHLKDAYQAGRFNRLTYQTLLEQGVSDEVTVYPLSYRQPGIAAYRLNSGRTIDVVMAHDYERTQQDPAFEPLTYRIPLDFTTA